MTKPQPPEGYGTVTPWVVTKDTRRLLQFIKEAFDAEELGRVEVEGGAIGHAEARIGDRWISTDRISMPATFWTAEVTVGGKLPVFCRLSAWTAVPAMTSLARA
jgi:uncharacterized glyoxalase superfamily protein PhnB